MIKFLNCSRLSTVAEKQIAKIEKHEAETNGKDLQPSEIVDVREQSGRHQWGYQFVIWL